VCSSDLPSFQSERQGVADLLQTLQQAGVRVSLSPTIKKGAAAEWDHQTATLRTQPQMPKRGSVDFLQVLNHEAIHVAQSGRAGSLTGRPKPVGLAGSNDASVSKKLNDPVYTGTTQWEQTLEREAYGNQDDTKKVKKPLQEECKLAINTPN